MSTDSARSVLEAVLSADRNLRRNLALVAPTPATETLLESIELSEQTIAVALTTRPTADSANEPDVRAELISALLTAQTDARHLVLRTRSHRISAVAPSIARLRRATSVDAMIRQTCTELTTALEFHRASYSTIDSHSCVLRYLRPQDDTQRPDSSTLRPLSPAERHCVDTRRPIVVNVQKARRPGDTMAILLDTPEYIVAPVIIGTEVRALIHAARATPWTVDSADGHLLDIIASAFAAVNDREVRTDRLHRQQHAVLAAARQLVADTDPFADTDIDFGLASSSIFPADSEPLNRRASRESLTAREEQVLTLIATGASNHQIAEELVIAVETVKSHVKRVLRKLGAINRSEAVSLYLEDPRTAWT